MDKKQMIEDFDNKQQSEIIKKALYEYGDTQELRDVINYQALALSRALTEGTKEMICVLVDHGIDPAQLMVGLGINLFMGQLEIALEDNVMLPEQADEMFERMTERYKLIREVQK